MAAPDLSHHHHHHQPTMKTSDLFDRMTDDQLITSYNHHADKFHRAWIVCMTRHYSEGAYIDASLVMDKESKALTSIDRYIYNNRPAEVHDRLLQEAIVKPHPRRLWADRFS
jgi:hypothetical protein